MALSTIPLLRLFASLASVLRTTLDGVPVDASIVITQLDALIAEIERGVQKDPVGGDWYRSDDIVERAMRTRAFAAIQRLAPAGSTYLDEARRLTERNGADGWMVVRLAGILRGLRDDYAAGYVQTVEELVHADVFADFLGMADELITKGYKDAAAVIAGSVLEEHLRNLATKHDVATATEGRPVKAETLNSNLVKAGAYNKLTQKSVTAMLDLRNSAAHGRYEQYDKTQAEAMIRDVQSLAERLPA